LSGYCIRIFSVSVIGELIFATP